MFSVHARIHRQRPLHHEFPIVFQLPRRRRRVQPPLFPCNTAHGTPSNPECDLTFTTSGVLNHAFGRAGYSLTVVATVARSSANPSSQFVLSSVVVSGYIYDYYQWDPAVNPWLADLQTGYMGPGCGSGYLPSGCGGLIYEDQVSLLTAPTPLTNIFFVFQ